MAVKVRDIRRIYPFCNEIATFWQTYCPDLRFWQVICVILDNMPNDFMKQDPFYAEEKEWLSAIKAATKSRKKENEKDE